MKSTSLEQLLPTILIPLRMVKYRGTRILAQAKSHTKIFITMIANLWIKKNSKSARAQFNLKRNIESIKRARKKKDLFKIWLVKDSISMQNSSLLQIDIIFISSKYKMKISIWCKAILEILPIKTFKDWLAIEATIESAKNELAKKYSTNKIILISTPGQHRLIMILSFLLKWS